MTAQGEDGGVAHFIDGVEGDLGEGLVSGTGHAEVAHDIFDDDDRVVDKDANREDQREEGDTVDGVTVEVKNEEGEREGGGDGEQDDEGLAPAEEKEDKESDAKDGDAHVEEELVGFFSGGVAVVAGDGELDLGGEEDAALKLDALEHGVDDIDSVGAGALGDGEGDGGAQVPAGGAVEDVVGGLGGGVGDGGDIAQVNWTAGPGADDDATDGGGVAEEVAGFEEEGSVGERAGAELGGLIGGAEGGGDLVGR